MSGLRGPAQTVDRRIADAALLILPAAQATTAYNVANQLTTWGAALTYDDNGILTSDGSNSLT